MKVSVVMSVYNGEKYLAEAIESVLAQTYKDFEFIIVNDGSKDGSLAILRQYEAKDNRVIVQDHENMGLGNSLNKAIEIAKGEWIARMDGDDIMLPNRLEEQIKFIEANPHVDVVSSWAYYINPKGETIGQFAYPTDLNNEIDSKRYLRTNKPIAIIHPSTIFRKSVVIEVGGYKPIVPGQDIELWNRMLEKGAVFVCMNKCLLKYRIHPHSITNSNYINALRYFDWLAECMIRRRKGEAEIAYQDYTKLLAKKPFLQRMHYWRKLYAKYSYRKASFSFGSKKYFSFFMNTIIAICLNPSDFVRKVRNKMKRLFAKN
ncbi:MAG: glycosyltransferase [Thermoflexibacter sp.]|nr:glycosyltransferase [Thermoflexibacter sp.]